MIRRKLHMLLTANDAEHFLDLYQPFRYNEKKKLMEM